MNDRLSFLLEKATSTEYERWRRVISLIFWFLMCTSGVGSFLYLYLSTPSMHCLKGLVIASIVWLIGEYAVLAYLYIDRNIQLYARVAIQIVIAFGNIWFLLLVFTIRSC